MVEQQGKLPAQEPAVSGEHLALYGEAPALKCPDALERIPREAHPGDYLADPGVSSRGASHRREAAADPQAAAQAASRFATTSATVRATFIPLANSTRVDRTRGCS